MLKIDLLPKAFARAKTNRMLIIVGVILLALCAVYWLYASSAVQKQIADTEQKIAQVKPAADEVDRLSAELSKKQADLKPIADKVDFVAKADESGVVYWDQYHKIKRYIYGRAQVSDFSITPPNNVSFTATVHGTTEYARFLLNILRCPYMTLSGFQALSAGRQIPSSEQAEPGEWPTAQGKEATGGTTAATPGRQAMGMGMGMGMGMDMGGVPGMGPAGMGAPPMDAMSGAPPGMSGPPPGMGGAPGDMGMMGMGMGPGMGMGAGGGAATSAPEDQEIRLQIRGTLKETITVPAPAGAAAAAGAGMGMGMDMGMGMAPGMAPGMMGPEMGMGPGGGPPSGAPSGPPSGPAGGAGEEGGGDDGGGGEE